MLVCIDYICAILARGVNLVFHLIPTEIPLWIGRRMGGLICLLHSSRRKIGYANLRAVFSREKSPRELRRLISGVYRHLFQVFFEILTLTKVNERYIDKYIEVINPDNVLRVKGHPRGIILLGAHFGNWELSGMVSANKGLPIVVLAREQKMKKLNELIVRLRELKGVKVVGKGITTRIIVETLHAGKVIGMVGDQDAGKTGELIEFFGRQSSTAAGTMRIAAKTGAYVIPGFMARTRGPYHRMMLEEPFKVEKGDDIRAHLLHYNRILEKYVRMYPEQWLWIHKRWKSTPLKKVALLTDGKPGHFSQADSVFRLLKRYREDSGYSSTDTAAETFEIKFKNSFAKKFLNFLSLFSNSSCQGCMKCMRLCLTRDSYEKLMSSYANVVIGCGSGTAGVNRLFSIENNATSAHVLKPSILGLWQFDMVILPAHDGIKPTKDGRVIAIDTTLNKIDEEAMKKGVSKLKETVLLEGMKKIGVLLGGDNSDYALTEEMTEGLVSNVIDAASRTKSDILLTTSRRTPEASRRKVSSGLGPEKRCKFLVLANEKNVPLAVEGILGASDVLVVSGESASMVSEAVSSGKKVIVFRLKKKRKKRSKFENMLANMEKKGYVVITEIDELSGAICRSLHAPQRQNEPEDEYNVYKYMWRLS